MARRIDTISFNELAPTLRILGSVDVTTDDAAWLRSPGNAQKLADFLHQARCQTGVNPFRLSVRDQLGRFWQANQEERWGVHITHTSFLEENAPDWPQGPLAFRSLRIRIGRGGEGVARTFEAHTARIRAVFGTDHYYCDERLQSGEKRLRLLNGNDTHEPVVEWVIIDLDSYRRREDVTTVRGRRSLADELLVVAWMFPEYIQAIDYKDVPCPIAAGYEASNPYEHPWSLVPCLSFDRSRQDIQLHLSSKLERDPTCSVPTLRE